MDDNVRGVSLTWSGSGFQFAGCGEKPASPEISIDGDSGSGPSPVQLLLLAGASCAASDVVHILGKMRVEFDTLSVKASGLRRETEPRRFETMHLEFAVRGADVPLQKVQQAVDLSLDKYCSVVHSLRETIEISSTVLVG